MKQCSVFVFLFPGDLNEYFDCSTIFILSLGPSNVTDPLFEELYSCDVEGSLIVKLLILLEYAAWVSLCNEVGINSTFDERSRFVSSGLLESVSLD